MEKHIGVLAGDGIGPEVMESALKVLDAIARIYGHRFVWKKGLIGGETYDTCKNHFPHNTYRLCQEADAILLGSIGGPQAEQHLEKWQNCKANSLLALRQSLQFNINIRPARVYRGLKAVCPLRDRLINEGVDVLIVRELLGDLYFGKHEIREEDGWLMAIDEARYDEREIGAVARFALQTARKRRGKVTSIDKANVLATSQLWRQVVTKVAQDYPDIELEHMFVDNAAMQLIQNPEQFDVVLCPNMFGDILSDLASVLPGSLGMVPSASFNYNKGQGLYEPAGGSAPDIAGQGIANPIAQILSGALMLRYSFGMEGEARHIESAIELCLQHGNKTADLAHGYENPIGTLEMTEAIIQEIQRSG